MSCSGNCTLCGFLRNSANCKCFTRSRNNDGFHSSLAHVVYDLQNLEQSRVRFANGTSVKFWRYSKADHENLLLRVGEIVHNQRERVIVRTLDGFEFNRIERDAERVVAIGKGKLFANGQRYSELTAAQRRELDDRRNKPPIDPTASNASMLTRLRASLTPTQS